MDEHFTFYGIIISIIKEICISIAFKEILNNE